MGLLDDLRKQAGDLQSQAETDHARRTRNMLLAQSAAETVHGFLNEFARLLATIRPVSKVVYRLDAKTSFAGLPLDEFRFDARRKMLLQREGYDTIDFGCLLRGGPARRLEKDFVREIEQLEARLRQSGMTWQREEVRDGDARLTQVRYHVGCDIRLGVRVVPEHDQGVLRFTVNNLDGFERVQCELAAHEITQARMEEFGRWWLGEQHRFLDGARQLRRIEPR